MMYLLIAILASIPGLVCYDECDEGLYNINIKCGQHCAYSCKCGSDKTLNRYSDEYCCVPQHTNCTSDGGGRYPTVSCPGGTPLAWSQKCHGECHYYREKYNYERNYIPCDTEDRCVPVQDVCVDTQCFNQVLFIYHVIIILF